MVHFQLQKEASDLDGSVPVELEGFGEFTEDMLFERVYPVYNEILSEATEDLNDESPAEKRTAAQQKVNDALTTERDRQWGAKKPELSEDPEAAALQTKDTNLPKTVAESIVKEHPRRKIIEMPPSTDKVQ